MNAKKRRWHCLRGQEPTELDKQVMYWEGKGKLVPTRDLIKTPEQAGGPLNQFGTIGVYFETGGAVLYEERLLRLECGSHYSDVDEDE